MNRDDTLGFSGIRRRQALGAALAAWPLAAAAADWPHKPIRMLVTYPAGGLSDGIGRTLARALAEALNTPVVVENRPGAGGGVGMELLARAAPDGHTIALSAITPLTLQPLLARTPYDAARDIAPVAALMHTPVLVVGTPALRGCDFDQLLALARAHSGAVRWASSGYATTGHLVLAQVRAASGCVMVHVPYHGGGQQLNDALAGHFEVLSSNVGATQLEYVRTGRLQALAVGAPARLEVLSGVPTLAELGFPAANLMSLFGIFAPARTPPVVIARLNAEVNRALRGGALQDPLRQSHNLPAVGSPQDFARWIEQDLASNRRLLGSRTVLD